MSHLHLESGDITSASNEAEQAFRLGHEKQDYILMARARIVQATSELARAEEQLGEDPDIVRHAHLAVDYADQAITLALGTQNKRLHAEAYIARGFIAASDFFGEWEVASDLANKAVKLLSLGDRDHLYKSLTDLMKILTRVSSVDERLRLWSIGQLGSKSLTQVQEEFSELVIQSAWESNGKNITSVAKVLRTSPKRIRRALRRLNERDDRFNTPVGNCEPRWQNRTSTPHRSFHVNRKSRLVRAKCCLLPRVLRHSLLHGFRREC